MARYLTSLRKAFTSERLQHVQLEAHIFMDNCVDEDLHLNQYCRRVLALIAQVLQVPATALRPLATPYGCQVG